MKYNGKELKEFTSDKPVVFDPPKRMLCWDNIEVPKEQEVVAYLPMMPVPVFTAFDRFAHCAEFPEEPKSRRATNRELARWLVQGNGERIYKDDSEPDDGDLVFAHTTHCYCTGEEDDIVPKEHFVRKWGDTEWHEPTADYMGLDG